MSVEKRGTWWNPRPHPRKDRQETGGLEEGAAAGLRVGFRVAGVGGESLTARKVTLETQNGSYSIQSIQSIGSISAGCPRSTGRPTGSRWSGWPLRSRSSNRDIQDAGIRGTHTGLDDQHVATRRVLAPLAVGRSAPEIVGETRSLARRYTGAMNAIEEMACATSGCDNRGKPGLNIVGYGSFATKAGRRQRYRCTVCRGTLSTNTATAYSGLRCTRREFDQVVSLHVEGVSISATARVTGHSRKHDRSMARAGLDSGRTPRRR